MEMYEMELKRSIKKEDDFEIYLNIGNLLHWIIMTEEWHKEHNNKRDKYEKVKRKNNMVNLMRAVRFANNSMKHNMIFQILHLKPTAVACGSSGAICGTFSSGTSQVIWNKIKGFNSKKPWEIQQYESYIKCLELKSIKSTLRPVVSFLKTETNDYLLAHTDNISSNGGNLL